ncbi:MAG: biotin-dependent carboxyltransferase [Desulfobacterales bacterium]|nr:biotin-dependent carboxyltransferase [Desulfobacterales bacterium]
MKTLEIISPGIHTTIQDKGRFGFGQYGVAPSGALDGFSLRIGNLLVGNPEDEACLETVLLGLSIKFLSDAVIAVTGADLQPALNNAPLAMWQSHAVKKGDALTCKGPKSGCRAYLAVGRGILLPRVMGSKSTNLPAGFGGMDGRALKKGDILSTGAGQDAPGPAGRVVDPGRIPVYTAQWTLRVIPGPQDDHFSPSGLDAFLHSEYTASTRSDRTGIRLEGEKIEQKPGLAESIISEGVIPGAIQVPGDGLPIIILVETVTGGYRKIAAVISADLPLLGQVKPGDRVRFQAVSMPEAIEAARDMEENIQSIKSSFEAIT